MRNLWGILLQTIFCVLFAARNLTSAYDNWWLSNSFSMLKWVLACTATGCLTLLSVKPLYGFLFVPILYFILVIFNFSTSILCFFTEGLARKVAKNYLSYCVRSGIKPKIPFIIFLRPFSLDASLALCYFDPMDTIDKGGEIIVAGYYEGRPVISNTHVNLSALSNI
jgi:hypothetical protein